MKQEQYESNPFKSREFVLVFVLVISLLVTILMIFIASSGTDRKDLLAIVLGAFGAWIGAGAAYFFGRENLRAATDSMLKMRSVSPQERLIQTALGNMKLNPVPKSFERDDTLGEVMKWLKEDPDRFYVLVVTKEGTAVRAIESEAVYRYVLGDAKPDLTKQTLGDAIIYIEQQAESLTDTSKSKAMRCLVNAAIILKDTESTMLAIQMMEQQNNFVTIVVNDKGSPVGTITTGDIRRFILTETI